jgi:hypothetical protein
MCAAGGASERLRIKRMRAANNAVRLAASVPVAAADAFARAGVGEPGAIFEASVLGGDVEKGPTMRPGLPHQRAAVTLNPTLLPREAAGRSLSLFGEPLAVNDAAPGWSC